LQENIANTH